MSNSTVMNDGCVPSLVEEDEEEQNFGYAWQIIESMALPMVMKVVIELDILGIIARAGTGLLASEITASIGDVRNPMAASMVDRMLWMLATYKIVTCSVVESKDGEIKKKYGLSPVAKYFVPNEEGESLAPLMSLNQDKVFVDGW